MLDEDLPELGVVRQARACRSQWAEQPDPGAPVAECPECRCKVYNFAGLSSEEARQVLRRTAPDGRIEARLFQRVSGTLMTRDCPRGMRRGWSPVGRLGGGPRLAITTALVLAGFLGAAVFTITLFGDNIRRLFAMSSGCHQFYGVPLSPPSRAQLRPGSLGRHRFQDDSDHRAATPAAVRRAPDLLRR